MERRPETPTSEIIFFFDFLSIQKCVRSNGLEDPKSYHPGWRKGSMEPRPVLCSPGAPVSPTEQWTRQLWQIQPWTTEPFRLRVIVRDPCSKGYCSPVPSLDMAAYPIPFLSSAHAPWKTSAFLHPESVISMTNSQIFLQHVPHNPRSAGDQSNQVSTVR